MDWFTRFAEVTGRGHELAGHTTLGIGGPARFFCEPRSVNQLAELLGELGQQHIPVWILGNGSNLLVDDLGVDGVVIGLHQLRWLSRHLDPEGGSQVEAGAGVLLPHLVARTIRWGLAGLEERCVGIPGSVGGSICQNAGSQYGAFGDVVVSATVVTSSGAIEERSSHALGFGYRQSNLRGDVVAGARLRLEQGVPRILASRARVVMKYRKATQPLQDRTPGCIFMNPAGGRSAGRLLDEAGMKGRRRGRASVSEKHANFIVNRGGARAQDVRDLIREAHDRVLDRFGVDLSLEIVEWPRRSVLETSRLCS